MMHFYVAKSHFNECDDWKYCFDNDILTFFKISGLGI